MLQFYGYVMCATVQESLHNKYYSFFIPIILFISRWIRDTDRHNLLLELINKKNNPSFSLFPNLSLSLNLFPIVNRSNHIHSCAFAFEKSNRSQVRNELRRKEESRQLRDQVRFPPIQAFFFPQNQNATTRFGESSDNRIVGCR